MTLKRAYSMSISIPDVKAAQEVTVVPEVAADAKEVLTCNLDTAY